MTQQPRTGHRRGDGRAAGMADEARPFPAPPAPDTGRGDSSASAAPRRCATPPERPRSIVSRVGLVRPGDGVLELLGGVGLAEEALEEHVDERAPSRRRRRRGAGPAASDSSRSGPIMTSRRRGRGVRPPAPARRRVRTTTRPSPVDPGGVDHRERVLRALGAVVGSDASGRSERPLPRGSKVSTVYEAGQEAGSGTSTCGSGRSPTSASAAPSAARCRIAPRRRERRHARRTRHYRLGSAAPRRIVDRGDHRASLLGRGSPRRTPQDQVEADRVARMRADARILRR